MGPDTEGMALSDNDRRLLGYWAADCGERALPLFEERVPADRRPRTAIDGVRTFALGGRRTWQLRSLAWAAHAAAREVSDPVAAAAARAAAYAAATPYIHALTAPHQVNHALGSAMYLAHARELAAGDDPDIGDGEIRWAVEHASPAVHDVVRRIPVNHPGRTRLGALRHQLQEHLQR